MQLIDYIIIILTIIAIICFIKRQIKNVEGFFNPDEKAGIINASQILKNIGDKQEVVVDSLRIGNWKLIQEGDTFTIRNVATDNDVRYAFDPSGFMNLGRDINIPGNVHVGGDINIKGGNSIRSDGRLHIAPAENLYLLPTNGTYLNKSWDSNGSLSIENWKLQDENGNFVIRDNKSGDHRLALSPGNGDMSYTGQLTVKNASGNDMRLDGWGPNSVTESKYGNDTFQDAVLRTRGSIW